MSKSPSLALERLEDRSTPSNSGVTWADGRHLTLSFVPDGTLVGAAHSNLFSTLNAVAPTATWQREIVRAVQTWAVNANLNVGVVADDGSPLGVAGAVQGDERFGDIRIAAVALPTSTIITNTPFQWSGTTWSGDILVNSANVFSVNGSGKSYDLFTAMLNEAGNVLGVLDNRRDTTSGVYYQYAGVHTGINAADVADIRSLYGSRTADQFDAVQSNGSLASAKNLGNTIAQPLVEADITSIGDVDYYRFTVPLGTPLLGTAITVVTNGVSALQPQLQIYNALGVQVGSAVAANPLGGDLVVHLGTLSLGGTYYARVAANSNTVFGVGGYKLSIAYQLLNGTISGGLGNITGFLSNELGLNDLLSTATNVLPPLGPKPDARFDVATRGTILTALDVDYYRITAPLSAAGPQKLNVLAWSLELNTLKPKVEVFDAAGHPLATKLLGNEDGTFAVEVSGITPGAAYFVKVSALNPGGLRVIGDYFLGANFSSQPETALEDYAVNTIGRPNIVQTNRLSTTQNKLFEFVLSADAGSAGSWSQIKMEVVDASGQVIYTLLAYSGVPAASGHVYLTTGRYTVRFSAAPRTGTAFVPVSYTLKARIVSDPIGPRTETGGNTPKGNTWSDGGNSVTNGPSFWDRPTYF